MGTVFGDIWSVIIVGYNKNSGDKESTQSFWKVITGRECSAGHY